ncbi:hypothetical protein J40TS1_08420 [Paenibacillus montaniterrae]|uniref:Peptidase M10 metallopeptidase domain-containing protein n=1 Tax=Paenibacillus montaniterrae TaxID=429341 RepID=A0A920CWG2_9BACL|nr:M43 family zinc metalloprotease [Paenibacillus montaniterrae]GIP15200.1 hypothetical protein J40TS1_08420 [Paenibacillus montaniterrae]
MKAIKFPRLLFLFSISIISFVIATTAIADTFNLNWSHVTNKTVQLKTSNTYLTGDWGNRYSVGISNWNSSTARVNITTTAFSSSTVDMYSVDKDTWKRNGWGSWYGWAQLFSGGSACNTNAGDPDLLCTSADYAGVYFSEEYYPTGNNAQASGTITHELGHVAGLKHTTSSSTSVMHLQGNAKRTNTVTTYDAGQINGKY